MCQINNNKYTTQFNQSLSCSKDFDLIELVRNFKTLPLSVEWKQSDSSIHIVHAGERSSTNTNRGRSKNQFNQLGSDLKQDKVLRLVLSNIKTFQRVPQLLRGTPMHCTFLSLTTTNIYTLIEINTRLRQGSNRSWRQLFPVFQVIFQNLIYFYNVGLLYYFKELSLSIIIAF